MPRLAANLSTLFKEHAFAERFAAAARAGFQAVEYQYPYEWRAEELAAHAREAGVQVVLHNMPRGDAALGEHGTACLPGREARFREDLEADSLDLVELIMAFEEEFGAEISDEDAQTITTVGEAVKYIDARKDNKKPAVA